ncbi:MAG: hypothetical protein H8E82_05485 [Candidatus Marinimicrobia bacterium]|nr:hypothetical protein [Candidatus Neomarinimicrobiota bacterium]
MDLSKKRGSSPQTGRGVGKERVSEEEKFNFALRVEISKNGCRKPIPSRAGQVSVRNRTTGLIKSLKLTHMTVFWEIKAIGPSLFPLLAKSQDPDLSGEGMKGWSELSKPARHQEGRG